MLAEEAEALQSPSPLWKRIVEVGEGSEPRGRQLIRAGMLNLETELGAPLPITSPVAWLPPPEWAFSGGGTPAPPLLGWGCPEGTRETLPR